MSVTSTPIGSTLISETFSAWIVRANIAYARIDEIVPFVNQLETNQGSLPSLLTTDKTSLVNAINELYTDFQAGTLIQATTGLLANLTTTNKTNLVAAINELDGEIGDLSTLTTTANGTLVAAINEAAAASSSVGNLALLGTTAKTDLVAAINEVLAGLGDVSTLTTTANTAVGAINELDSGQGNLSTLSTTAKTSLVAAINEVVAGLSGYIAVDGSSTVTADITLSGFKLTSIADGVAITDAASVGQIPTLAMTGDLTTLLTTAQGTLVDAINEVITESVPRSSTIGSAILPSGTTAQRDASPTNGMFRYNSTLGSMEAYAGGAWTLIGGGNKFTANATPPAAGNTPGDWFHDTDSDIVFLRDTDGATEIWRDMTSLLGGNRTPKGVAADTTAVPSDEIWVNTSLAGYTITLPSTPSEGAKVRVVRQGANAVIVARNGSTIGGLTSDYTIGTDNVYVEFTYMFSTWKGVETPVVI